jgi:hypothetical protein
MVCLEPGFTGFQDVDDKKIVLLQDEGGIILSKYLKDSSWQASNLRRSIPGCAGKTDICLLLCFVYQ